MNARGPDKSRESRDGDRIGAELSRPAEGPAGGVAARKASDAKSTRAADQLEVATYIENLCAELRQMARTADLESLAYFLEMSRIEATHQVEIRSGIGKAKS